MEQETINQEKLKDKLILKRDKNLIYIRSNNSKDILRYNLTAKYLEKYNSLKNKWVIVKQQYIFFRDFTINDIECEEEHFKKMIEKAKYLNPSCKNLSSFITRLHESLNYENYEKMGLKTECHVNYWGRRRSKTILEEPLEFYSRDVIKFFINNKIEVTKKIENAFKKDYELMKNVINIISDDKYTLIERNDFLQDIISSITELKSLVISYKYNIKSLINYIYGYLKPFENIEPDEALELLSDYYSMANKIGRDVKKYPKYLKSMHDIITSNYNSFKKEYDENHFKRLIRYDLETENRIYSIIVPKCSKDIISEGTSLNHCVGSYIDKILNNETYIFFLRLTENKDQSLITLELRNNELVQAKGSYNRRISKEESEFLINYCKKLNIKYRIGG